MGALGLLLDDLVFVLSLVDFFIVAVAVDICSGIIKLTIVRGGECAGENVNEIKERKGNILTSYFKIITLYKCFNVEVYVHLKSCSFASFSLILDTKIS